MLEIGKEYYIEFSDGNKFNAKIISLDGIFVELRKIGSDLIEGINIKNIEKYNEIKNNNLIIVKKQNYNYNDFLKNIENSAKNVFEKYQYKKTDIIEIKKNVKKYDIETIKLLHSYEYAEKINELYFKYSRSHFFLNKFKNIIEKYKEEIIFLKIIYNILSINNITYYEFFKKIPTNSFFYITDSLIEYDKQNIIESNNSLERYFEFNLLSDENILEWFFLIKTSNSKIPYFAFNYQFNHFNDIKRKFIEIIIFSIKYLIENNKLIKDSNIQYNIDNNTDEKNIIEIWDNIKKNTDSIIIKSNNNIAHDLFANIKNQYLEFYKKFQYSGALKLLEKHLDNEELKGNKEFLDLYNKVREDNISLKKFKNSLPKETNSNFYKAKVSQLIEKDFNKAEFYYQQCIETRESFYKSAIKDYMAMFSNEPEKSIEIAKKYEKYISIYEKLSFNNLFINILYKQKDYDHALIKTNENIAIITSKNINKKLLKSLYFMQGTLYLKKGRDYQKAIHAFEESMEYGNDKLICNRNIAICYLGLGDYNKAKLILEENIKNYSDLKSQEILEEIKNNFDNNFDIDELIENEISSTSDFNTSEFNKFIKFYLFKNENYYPGVSKEIIENKSFNESSINYLIDSIPYKKTFKERYEVNFSIAKIELYLNEQDLNGNNFTSNFYRYLYYSLRYYALYILYNENKNPDMIKNYYLIALSCLDKNNQLLQNELNYLMPIRDLLHISLYGKGFENYLDDDNNDTAKVKEKIIIDMISLIKHCKNLEDQKFIDFLNILSFNNKNKNLIFAIIQNDKTLNKTFIEFFNKFQDKKISSEKKLLEFLEKKIKEFLNEAELIKKNIEIIRKYTIDDIQQIDKIVSELNLNFLFNLDRQYLNNFKRYFLSFYSDFNSSDSFEERKSSIKYFEYNIEKLLQDIEDSPTFLSIEYLRETILYLKSSIEKYLNNLIESNEVDLEIEDLLNKYIKNENNKIDLQLKIKNLNKNSPPARNIKIFGKNNKANTSYPIYEINLLRGGESKAFEIPINVPITNYDSAFSLDLSICYDTENKKELYKDISLSISLEDESIFVKIENPYNVGGPVIEPKMFYGREKLINDLIEYFFKDKAQGIILYGQKRCGKSSVFYHLRKKIEKDCTNFIPIDFSMGNFAGVLNEGAPEKENIKNINNFINLITRQIEKYFKKEFGLNIKDALNYDIKEIENMQILTQFIEDSKQYIFEKTQLNKEFIIFIDEFTYIYEQLKKGFFPDDFLRSLKAIIEKRIFKAALIGEDTMSYFIKDYQNEFEVFNQQKITYLDEESAKKLIEDPIKINADKSRLSKEVIDEIYNLTAGSPYYIQIICQKLVDYLNNKKRNFFTIADLNNLIDKEILSGQNQLTEGKFECLFNIGSATEELKHLSEGRKKVLKIIAHKNQGGYCNFSDINVKMDKENIEKIIESLKSTDVIEVKDGNKYKIKVALFERFLRKNTNLEMGV